MPKEIVVRVFRFDPCRDSEPRYKTYKVPYEEGMTVLETLIYINDNLEPIAFRYECRFQSCGSCGVMVNDYPVLACKQVAQDGMKIDPLPIYPVIKDLVVDTSHYYIKRRQFRPFLERTKPLKEFPEPEVTYEVDKKYREYVDCIDCHLCQVVCPVLKKPGTKFAGPALMTYLARFSQDPRDELDRVTIALSEGLMECTLCGECDKVCPKGRKITDVDINRLRKLAESRGLI
jgi:succinate dehydrogenase/fumarate reductase iron-sulfur protein